MSYGYGGDRQQQRKLSEREEKIANFKLARHVTVTGGIGLVVLVGLIFGSAAGCKSYNRYQDVQEAKNQVKTSQIKWNNKVKLNEIEIAQQEQRVQIEKQKAEIRKQKAVGIREAQDIINKTLTPLYVQHEMVETLAEVGKSGKNNTVIYIPVGPNGLPTVATANAK